MDIGTQPKRTLVGIETRASNDSPQVIGEVWKRFMSEQLADAIANRTDDKLIAVYCDYEGDHTQPYTFFLGCAVDEVTDLPSGYTSRILPDGRYAKFIATGKMPDALMAEWQAVWASDLNRSFIADFEIHTHSSPDRVDIFVGIKSE